MILIVHTTKGNNNVGYSYWFAVVAAALMVIASFTSGGIANIFNRIAV
jgi:hypothetical protein